MDCRDFEDRLDVFEAGLLPSEDQAGAWEHVRACLRCRTLLALVRGESNVLEPEAGNDLALAILHRTSGAACLEAVERLCDCVDGALGTDDQEIVLLHLAHCPECGSLAETLVELSRNLPDMAALEPDAQFTGDVLRATAGVRWNRPRFDLQAWWNRLMCRPRFAWEVAYLGTLLILLALGNPAMLPKASALPQILIDRSDQLLEDTTSVLADQRSAAVRSLSVLRLQGQSLWDKAAAFRDRTTSALQRELAATLEQLKSDFIDGTAAEPPKNDLR